MDSLNILESAKLFPEQCQQVVLEVSQAHVPSECNLVSNVVISGMGGSALGGRVIASLERQILRVPIVVSTEYHLPNFVNEKSLVLISSYSGNTEETLNSLSEAIVRGAHIFIVATGGKLAEIAKEKNLPSYIYEPRHNPSCQPRMGLGYSIMSIVSLLARCQLIEPQPQLGKIGTLLKERQFPMEYERIAHILAGKIPVLIASEHLKGAIHCFKNQLNETSKNFAAVFDLPELNHHLMEGLAFPKTNPEGLHFVFFDSKHYHPEVRKRYELTMDVVKKNHIPYTLLEISNDTRLLEALEVMQTGGFISYYLSQENGIDPGPVPWVDFFKDALHTKK